MGDQPRPKRQCIPEENLIPVIKKIQDGETNFRTMRVAERQAIQKYILERMGEPRDSTILRGGDLSVYPRDKVQQGKLLDLKELAGRQVTCSLPNSSTNQKIGVIFGVPIADKEEEIMEAVADQDVTHVKRLPVRGRPDLWSETVLLTFANAIPDRIRIAAMSFQVHVSIPTPYRCRKCWRIGHTAARCGVTETRFKRCGQHHAMDYQCIKKCINCSNTDHEADSNECSEYEEAKIIIKIAYLEGISIREARQRQSKLCSSVTRRPTTTTLPAGQANHNYTTSPEVVALDTQVRALQDELKRMRETTIPQIQVEMKKMAVDLSKTKEKMSNFDSRFDKIEGAQSELAGKQESRFDRLETLLSDLCGKLMSQPVTTQTHHPNITQAMVTDDPLRSPTLPGLPHHGHQSLSPMLNATNNWDEEMDNTDYHDHE